MRGALAALGVAIGLGQGCAVKTTGVVHPAQPRPILETFEGATWQLSTPGDAEVLQWLDGHSVKVEGTAVGNRLRVSTWTVTDGLHALQVWVGPLAVEGAQVGMLDHNSGAYYVVDEAAAATLARYRGLPVLLEGWVDGAHHVRVLYFRVLADPETVREREEGR